MTTLQEVQGLKTGDSIMFQSANRGTTISFSREGEDLRFSDGDNKIWLTCQLCPSESFAIAKTIALSSGNSGVELVRKHRDASLVLYEVV